MSKFATLSLAASLSCGFLAAPALGFTPPTTTPAPATRPATNPEAVTIDQTTPVATAKSFFAAVEAGSADAAMNLIVNADDRVERMMRQLARATGAFADLNAAAKEAFGEGITDTQGFAGPPPSALEQATVQEEGDTATLTSPEFGEPMRFVRRDGKWYIDLTEQMDTVNEGDVAQMEQVVPLIARAYRETADDVRAGRVESMQEMEQAFAERMQRAMQEMAQQNAPEGAAEDGGE